MKKWLIGLLVVSLLLGMVACASSTSEPAKVTSTSASRDYSSQGGAPVPATAAAPTVTTKTTVNAGESVTWAGERMVIRSGNLALVVVDVAKTIEAIVGLASSSGGYVVSSNSWKDNERLEGNIAIRVPAARFNEVMQTIRGMAVEVSSESTSGQDVTEEYIDLSSKLRNLEAAEAQLLKLLEATGNITDILAVQRELTSTRADIEQTKGRMQYLEQSVSMSLVQVSLAQSKLSAEFTASTRNIRQGEDILFSAKVAGGFTPYSYAWDFGDGSTSTEEAPVHAYKAKGDYTVSLNVTDDRGNTDSQVRASYITILPGWDIGRIASSAWSGFLAFGRVVLDIIIWLLVFIPLWVIIGVIVYFAWWRRRKKKAKQS